MRLIAENLVLVRNERRLLNGVNFTLERGGALVLAGPNGAGKSSLLRALLGFLPFEQGQVRLEGAADAPLIEHAHYVGHADGLKQALTAGENLEFWVSMLGRSAISVRAALQLLRLAHVEHLPVGYLSAGQRRRVALARLLVAQRPLWLLDEPTTALDVATQAIFARICAEHLSEGGLILAATHMDLGFDAPRLLLGGEA